VERLSSERGLVELGRLRWGPRPDGSRLLSHLWWWGGVGAALPPERSKPQGRRYFPWSPRGANVA
jgi:hypothetical protein